ncbi:MAG: peptide deformylase [Actinomycetota bacterium]|nr:peptide deformylase [Actinomycetota bacterium]
MGEISDGRVAGAERSDDADVTAPDVTTGDVGSSAPANGTEPSEVGADEVDPLELDGPDPIPLRFFGDQILRRRTPALTDVTGDIVELAERMLVTLRVEEGIGLAAPQVGEQTRLFVHGLADEAPTVLINPEIVESRGEWVYTEGCLSIPGLYYELVRPKEVHVRAIGIDGEELEIEADELLGRVIQHELDHLDGVLMVDHLDGEDRDEALRELAGRVKGTLGASDPFLRGKPVRRGLRRLLG